MNYNTIFDIPSSLFEAIEFQFGHFFNLNSYFWYYSLLIYLFLYIHVGEFYYLGLNIVDSNKEIKYVVDWDISLKKKPNNDRISEFISTFLSSRYKIINKVSPFRVFP